MNKKFINNFISFKHFKYIIHTNNHILNKSFYNKKNYKLNSTIQLFISNSINKNNCLSANDISNLIQNKFNVKILDNVTKEINDKSIFFNKYGK